MKNWNLKDVIIIGVLIVLLVKLFTTHPSGKPTITVVRDTLYVHHDSTVYSKPTVVTTIKPVNIPPIYLPDTNYNRLKDQYNSLVDRYLAKNVVKDSLKIDSIGGVYVTDTVTANGIADRKWDYNLRERVITNTITKTNPPRRQIYYGIGADILSQGNLNSLSLEGLYKDKKDRMIGVGVGYNFPSKSPQLSLHYFSLLSFRKQ